MVVSSKITMRCGFLRVYLRKGDGKRQQQGPLRQTSFFRPFFFENQVLGQKSDFCDIVNCWFPEILCFFLGGVHMMIWGRFWWFGNLTAMQTLRFFRRVIKRLSHKTQHRVKTRPPLWRKTSQDGNQTCILFFGVSTVQQKIVNHFQG